MNILNFWFSKTKYNEYRNKGVRAIEISMNALKFIKKKVGTHDVTHLILASFLVASEIKHLRYVS